jgi:hypothetical protein
VLLLIIGVALASQDCAAQRLRSGGQRKPTRQELFAELTPSRLTNCTLRRYGESADGGYLMCENLMGGDQAAYSYGIDGRDQWGCDVARELHAPVHEYDCFNTTRVNCDGGALLFHEDCLGARNAVRKGRRFGTLADQIAANGDAAKHLILKIDIEGDEWASLLAAPDATLTAIDQLVVEFHGVDNPRFLQSVRRLKRFFYVAHFHANNNACRSGIEPFTAWANEVLLVNRSIGVPDPSGTVPAKSPLDSPNTPSLHDCQPVF